MHSCYAYYIEYPYTIIEKEIMAQPKSHVYSKMNEDGDIEKVITKQPRKSERDLNIPPEYFNLGMYLVVPLIIGVAGGIYLDNKFGTQGTFTLIGIVFGTISIFYNLYKLYKKG
ncbi:hypothetical protein COY16_06160 [Candidatus Roizmanbacteria bacterium CG_4_10_14_0_2_um_filter_39_13]|uniref:AtpZ/AtpI family protein n=1 Tax=Candidatus Roizmanbacteria bacterium CG_4_10_14_0_2_um_filter_39_13 TaxID=1974825 RepID=A0A2M7TV73_9BACT|nr:MAG: hypothetical protein COY16_06160 [Candidatus Roizmanbacteria bacterium CG_4_10_14_0_2_um_filter_39_13]